MLITLLISISSIASTGNFQWEEELKQAIEKEDLGQHVPKELANCDGSGDEVKMWTEFMKGLAYIESSWEADKVNPDDANGTPSKGLFQMTGGDTALGENCFGTKDSNSEAPKDPIKNIQCAVKKMKELISGQGGSSMGKGGSSAMSGSLYESASKYWGPLKKGAPAHPKVEFLVSDIAGNCGTKPFEPSVLGHGGSTQSQPARGGYKGRN